MAERITRHSPFSITFGGPRQKDLGKLRIELTDLTYEGGNIKDKRVVVVADLLRNPDPRITYSGLNHRGVIALVNQALDALNIGCEQHSCSPSNVGENDALYFGGPTIDDRIREIPFTSLSKYQQLLARQGTPNLDCAKMTRRHRRTSFRY